MHTTRHDHGLFCSAKEISIELVASFWVLGDQFSPAKDACSLVFVTATVAHGLFDIGIMTYFDYGQVGLNDVLLGVIKCACFGFAVPLMAVFAGLGASGGAPGVGRATTYAVIGGSVAVLALDFFLGLLGFWLLP